jgi:putative glutamine amidotransferase
MHPDAARAAFPTKTLQYIEQTMAQWVLKGGAMPVMIPSVNPASGSNGITLDHYAQWLDGLVLHGGVDMWPGSYGEVPLKPEWSGDKARDDYEMALARAFVAAGKPVFGICRGLQVINVTFGGTLYQDIATQHEGALVHRDGTIYDHNFHTLNVIPNTRLSELLPDAAHAKINSIHHQGIKDLAPGFIVEATCPNDGIIEAIRHTGSAWVAAVQWHPEFHSPALGTLDDDPLRADFFDAARAAQHPTPVLP